MEGLGKKERKKRASLEFVFFSGADALIAFLPIFFHWDIIVSQAGIMIAK